MSDLSNFKLMALDKNQVRTFYFISAIFTLFIGVAFIYNVGYLAGLPIVFLVILLGIFRIDTLAYLSVFITPLSLNLARTNLGVGVSVPSEPLMFGLFIIFWLKVLADGGLDKRILRHPVTIMIFIQLAWFVITTATSSLVIVSIKTTLARFTYVSVFYFMFLYLFSKFENISKFLWLYLIPLLMVIGYTIFNQFVAGFTEESAHIAMTPFYNDHTAYGTAISFFIPVVLALIFDKKKDNFSRVIQFVILFFLITAIVLSYSRASWVGLIGAFGCFFVFIFRIKPILVYTGFLLLIISAITFRTEIVLKLEQNTKVSSTNYSSHVGSIGNISTDDSNIERLNRWASAIRMFKTKPYLGYGPGTYMFKYAPFQKDSQKSRISTNQGTGGGSHSEFLGPLSEQGYLGPILFILLFVVAIQRASSFIKRCEDKSIRILAKGLLLGWITYLFQGSLNFFLDTEKISVPFWGFLAALVALEIYHDKRVSKNLSDQPTT